MAEACNMFIDEQDPNLKAAGICYNNIGNLQYKQANYLQAAENFHEAVIKAEECIKQHKDEIRQKLF